jgi:hypothetical protein
MISWSTQNVSAAEVWVQSGGRETPFAGGTSGQQAAPWISINSGQYVFTLYQVSSIGRIKLGSVTVTATLANPCWSYSPPAFKGRVGQIAFWNNSASRVTVKLYHPAAPETVFGTYLIDPNANWYLSQLVFGDDWGIQVNGSCIHSVGSVSDWKFFEGRYIHQTWLTRILPPR